VDSDGTLLAPSIRRTLALWASEEFSRVVTSALFLPKMDWAINVVWDVVSADVEI
jgi:hypothetical protein